MNVALTTLIGKVRTAIDEVVGQDVDSEFVSVLDSEIQQALIYAGNLLTLSLPDEMLLPTTLTGSAVTAHNSTSSGVGSIELPNDYLRLVLFKLTTWAQGVREVTDPLSELARMQASTWTCGTPEKPVVVPGGTQNGKRLLLYYTAGKSGSTYDHTIEEFSYIASPSISNNNFVSGLADSCEPLLVYRAAGILMEGKQHSSFADRFYKLSVITTQPAGE